MKTCTRCQVETDEFHRHPNTKDGLTSWCKKCMTEGRNKSRKRETDHRHYEHNKETYKARAATAHRRIQDLIREAKNGPCTDCGVTLPPECMDFDHVRGTKLFTIGLWKQASVPEGSTREQLIRDEIAKCEVRCPNCHRLRHHGL